ncbi:hypothetical protein BaRGS_00012081 [Batillaria attramentaria]|uniref:Uncharacterized protein n=1 Tax=Batillaria attramentaria TaxID=370345 RepID=A0ABD0LCA3_9CAEN
MPARNAPSCNGRHKPRIHVGDRIKKNIPLLHKAAGFVGSAAGAVTTAVPDATQLLGEEVKDAVEILQEGAGALGGTAGGPIAVINAVLLPLTLYNLVDASIELHNVRKEKENSKAGDYLRQVADFLQREIVDKDLIKIDAVGETLA